MTKKRFEVITRKTIFGEPLQEHEPKVKILIDTRVSEKWVFIDEENGHLLQFLDGKWQRLENPKAYLESLLALIK